MDQSLASPSSTRRDPDTVPGLLVVLLAAVTGATAALSIDVVEATRGAGGDEATHVAMALSAAYDGDLQYESADLNRFYRIYARPPEGIVLARGEGAGERPLFFAKGALHAIVAAPFVWLFGLNGLLLLNVMLLTGICSAGYAFLAVRCRPSVAIAFTMAFVGASITPIYAVRLTPDLLEFALVFLAYFLWLYKEVAERAAGPSRWLFGTGSDVAAVLLLALAAFSKPSILALACPIVALYCLRRRFAHAALAGAMLVFLAAGAFRFDCPRDRRLQLPARRGPAQVLYRVDRTALPARRTLRARHAGARRHSAAGWTLGHGGRARVRLQHRLPAGGPALRHRAVLLPGGGGHCLRPAPLAVRRGLAGARRVPRPPARQRSCWYCCRTPGPAAASRATATS